MYALELIVIGMQLTSAFICCLVVYLCLKLRRIEAEIKKIDKEIELHKMTNKYSNIKQ